MIWTGFLIGLLGSFHCVGMCGPIALSLPNSTKSNFQFIQSRIFYNSGRIITYTILGLLIGIFGRGLQLAGWQQFFSVATGIFIIIILIINGGQINIPGLSGAVAKLKKGLGWALKSQFKGRFLLIGALNGLLPCGFVYLALAGAVGAENYWQSGLYMALFGLGTFPLMLALTLSGKVIPLTWRGKLSRMAPYFAGGLAILFILRGLNLGIPYVSPKLVEKNITLEEMSECH